MGKAGIAIKGMISGTVESIKRVFEFMGRSIAIANEEQKNARIEVGNMEYTHKLRLNNIRCVLVGPQQAIICYDQYTGKVI